MTISRTTFGIIILMIFTLFMVSFAYITMANEDNESTVQGAARNAMTKAINMGDARVSEEITINTEIARQALVRHYAETTGFHDGEKRLNIYKISSKPAMISVESNNKVDTPVMKLTNFFTKSNQDTHARTRQTEIIIYEARKLNK